MHLIMQQEKPDDYVIATGVTTTVRDFVKLSFGFIGVTIEFEGEGLNEIGKITAVDEEKFKKEVSEEFVDMIKSKIGKKIVSVDPRYFRPTEVEYLLGNPEKAKRVLGWEPEYDLEHLCEDMVQSDIKLMKKEAYLKKGGFRIMNYFE